MNEKLIERLQTEFEDREDEAEKLDGLVHDEVSRMGSAINNGGIMEQIEFLIQANYTEDDIRDAFGEKGSPC